MGGCPNINVIAHIDPDDGNEYLRSIEHWHGLSPEKSLAHKAYIPWILYVGTENCLPNKNRVGFHDNVVKLSGTGIWGSICKVFLHWFSFVKRHYFPTPAPRLTVTFRSPNFWNNRPSAEGAVLLNEISRPYREEGWFSPRCSWTQGHSGVESRVNEVLIVVEARSPAAGLMAKRTSVIEQFPMTLE